MRTLSHVEARRVYDRIGKGQDWQAFYEDRATDQLVRHGNFSAAQSVFEFGCGTGRFAARLLSEHLPKSARYLAVDLSPTMVRLAQSRLEAFGERVEVLLTEGEPPSGQAAGDFDRFVSNYVLDLLSQNDIELVLDEAHRMLRPGGLACLVSLTTGTTPVSRLVSGIWSRIHKLQPALVGGCRAIQLGAVLPKTHWRLVHHLNLAPFGIPSEVVVAERH